VNRVLVLLVLAACVDTTGSALVTFHAAAAGPADATGGPLTFGDITITKAKLHVGAVYLRLTQPSAGSQEQPCILPAYTYNGEVREGFDVDLLSPDPQPFPVDGSGTADSSLIAEVWLTGGPVDATEDRTVILDLMGTAAGKPFSASFHIGANFALPGSPGQPGAHAICKQRIVTPIRLDPPFAPTQGGTLLVRVDPRGWFTNVDFTKLAADGAFPDSNDDQNSLNLFNAMSATAGYSVTFAPGAPP
jgi:hypothetical protein